MDKILKQLDKVINSCLDKEKELVKSLDDAAVLVQNNAKRASELDEVESLLKKREAGVKGIESAVALLDEAKKLKAESEVSMAEVGSRSKIFADYETDIKNGLAKRESLVARRESLIAKKEAELEQAILAKVQSILKK